MPIRLLTPKVVVSYLFDDEGDYHCDITVNISSCERRFRKEI